VLGAPLGLSSTVTYGIVSALERTIQIPGENGQAALLIDAIQIHAAIDPGNSGGSLVNCTVAITLSQKLGGKVTIGYQLNGQADHLQLTLAAQP
jgi:hypothetical protein